MTPGPRAAIAGRRFSITGTVQGVGLRPALFRLAQSIGVSGCVRNVSGGVHFDAFGTTAQLAACDDRLATMQLGDRALRFQSFPLEADPPPTNFVVAASLERGSHALALAPDLATCDACFADTLRPGDRRFGYPFTSCAACGPRLSIATASPFDRATTSMAAFPLCRACRREYDDSADRRFHAETIACPDCGPRLRWRSAVNAIDEIDGIDIDPLSSGVLALRRGEIVAIQGLGGYHLACSATDDAAVQRLRQRKRRALQPLAVLVRDVDEATRLASIEAGEFDLLRSPARPIVLCRSRQPSPLAPGVAPDSHLVGLMLPYTPLHRQLVEKFAGPVVLTSGNRHGEPIACDTQSASASLSGIADHFLEHDRVITIRGDDSVVRWIAGGPVFLRRSRGYAPIPIAVATPFAVPVLGLGGQGKNTFCLGVEGNAYFSPHMGDLHTIEAVDAWRDAVAQLCRLLAVEPAVVAHDLHPGYATTRLAQGWPHATHVAVQHHHAHVVAAAAAAGLSLDDAVVGVAFDGTGAGDDGTAWGGEILRAQADGYERLATLRPLRLAGGERAITEIWRIAAALLFDAYDGAIPAYALSWLPVSPADAAAVLDLLRRNVACVPAHGAGRYFDAVRALLGGPASIDFDGQAAMQLETLALDASDSPTYPYRIDDSDTVVEIDLRPTVRALVEARRSHAPDAAIAARFHRTLAAATADTLHRLELRLGPCPVVLAGGCFQNRRFTESLLAELGPRANVHLPRDLPPGDGGLALGQALVAAATLRREQQPAARAMAAPMTTAAERA